MKAPANVRAALDDALASGEVGLQVAAYLDGELVIDAWAGFADEAGARPVDGDTLFTVFSATKAVAAVAVHMQVARGLLDYDGPVAATWPEFGKYGKETVTVRQVLDHSAGVPQMPRSLRPEEMCNWDLMCGAIAALEPLWPPGTKHGYHAYTFGWICGELVRRSDRKRRAFRQWVLDEICAPLGICDLWLGIPDEAEPRVAEIIDLPKVRGAPPVPPQSTLAKAIPPHLSTDRATFGRPDLRRACHPGAGGIMNARSLARLYAMLASGGELDGVRVLPPEAITAMRTLQSDAEDAVIGRGYRRGMGFWLSGANDSNSPVFGRSPAAFGHPGAGGSIGWCDPDAGLAVAIAKNRMLAPPSAAENPVFHIAEAVRAALLT